MAASTLHRPPRPGRRLRQRNALVEANLHLVRPIAAHYAAHSAECRDDLQQVGLLGHIRGAILHYLRDTAPLVRPPRRLQERRQQIQKLQTTLHHSLGREARPEEIRQAMGLSDRQWRQSEQLGLWPERFWLDQTLLEQLPCPEQDPGAPVDGVLEGLQSLELRQRRVVQAVVLQGQSLRTVARRQHSSAATVHRLLHRGLAELRTLLTPPSDAPAC